MAILLLAQMSLAFRHSLILPSRALGLGTISVCQLLLVKPLLLVGTPFLRIHMVLTRIILLDFTGLDWWTHDRLVNYDMPNPAEEDISNWLIENPQRLSMANIGLHFPGQNITENDLLYKSQYLDIWEGTIQSSFCYNGSKVSVQVWCHPADPIVGIQIKSDLLISGDMGVFFDFPNSDTNKFDAPYVGVWNDTTNSTVLMQSTPHMASFEHVLDSNINRLGVKWNAKGSVSGPLSGTNRFILTPLGSNTLQLVADFQPASGAHYDFPSFESIAVASREWWENYWTSGSFIDLSATDNVNATELQRRIILSQYLVAVNEASYNPPQGKSLNVFFLMTICTNLPPRIW